MKLILIKFTHSLVFIVETVAILYILYSGLYDVQNMWLAVAIALVLLESGVYIGNGTRCPMTNLARELGDATGDDYIADIFLPRWFAPLIPPLCGTLAAIGLILVIARAVVF